jgi:hypothetical protein
MTATTACTTGHGAKKKHMKIRLVHEGSNSARQKDVNIRVLHHKVCYEFHLPQARSRGFNKVGVGSESIVVSST